MLRGIAILVGALLALLFRACSTRETVAHWLAVNAVADEPEVNLSRP